MTTMIHYASVCSGIEAAAIALHPLGFNAQWFSDTDPFASAVLAHHYPHIPNHGDMCTLPERIGRGEIPPPDLLCAGTPCQAFSSVGRRASLADARGNLTLALVELLNACNSAHPTVLLWENVIGVLSTKDNAFGHVLAALAGTNTPLVCPAGEGKSWPGAGWVSGPRRRIAWRTLDAQHFALPQQRRRVFLVASPASSHIDPAQILFESHSGSRDVATAQTDSHENHTAPRPDPGTHQSRIDANGNRLIAKCLGTQQNHDVLTCNFIIDPDGWPRKLTPLECERLQGFPDNYTRIPWRGKPAHECPDTLRWRAIGNAWPVPVIVWLGHRLANAMRKETT